MKIHEAMNLSRLQNSVTASYLPINSTPKVGAVVTDRRDAASGFPAAAPVQTQQYNRQVRMANAWFTRWQQNYTNLVSPLSLSLSLSAALSLC